MVKYPRLEHRKETLLSAIRNPWKKTLATKQIYSEINRLEDDKRQMLTDLLSFYTHLVYIEDEFSKEQAPSFESQCVSLSERVSVISGGLNRLLEGVRSVDDALEKGFDKTYRENAYFGGYLYRKTLKTLAFILTQEFSEANISIRVAAWVRNSYGNEYGILSMTEKGLEQIFLRDSHKADEVIESL